MAKRRFVAPARDEVPATVWSSPLFAPFSAYASWFVGACWPDIDVLNQALNSACHAHSGRALRFVAQTDALLLDGCHYESRIYERGEISTRLENWHDLFNAVMWIEFTALKSALNTRQYIDVMQVGSRERTPGQCAMTQFDEAGVVVALRDDALLPLWDAHDWSALFWDNQSAWRDGRISIHVFGHALLEHALHPAMLLVGKCIVVTGNADAALTTVAQAITDASVLHSPSELRPLPLSGIPGWHAETGDPAFYQQAPCFRPRRLDRCYPAPLTAL